MLKLNFDLYSGKALLKNWWRQVKANFEAVQSAFDSLETAFETKDEAVTELKEDMKTERKEREAADMVLQRNIAGEAEARKAGDEELKKSIKSAIDSVHSHSNKKVLDDITADDLAAWRTEKGDAAAVEFLNVVCAEMVGYVRGLLKDTYGYEIYDGGIECEIDQSRGELDGGELSATLTATRDFGDFSV